MISDSFVSQIFSMNKLIWFTNAIWPLAAVNSLVEEVIQLSVYDIFCVSGRWECPWHQCDLCGQEAASFCEMCPSSYCVEHRDGMLFISKLDGRLSCSEHDPCGPEPLEPGEIREYPPQLMTTYPINFIRAAKTKSTTLNTTAVPQAPSPPDVAPQVSFSPSSSPPPLDMPLNCAYSPISPYGEEKAEEEESLIQLERDGEKSITQENSERLMIKKKTEVWRFNL